MLVSLPSCLTLELTAFATSSPTANTDLLPWSDSEGDTAENGVELRELSSILILDVGLPVEHSGRSTCQLRRTLRGRANKQVVLCPLREICPDQLD